MIKKTKIQRRTSEKMTVSDLQVSQRKSVRRKLQMQDLTINTAAAAIGLGRPSMCFTPDISSINATKSVLDSRLNPRSNVNSSPNRSPTNKRNFKRAGSLRKAVTRREYLKKLEQSEQLMKIQVELLRRMKLIENLPYPTNKQISKCPFT
ncbi:uncharacterized protein LOC143462756 [Clavelina lepadiformis]|uniref:uncharacterized protein LOC143462756 n=1 Tax=Clavelina lepadiformis TaxID=159417 RepID=UPI004042E707